MEIKDCSSGYDSKHAHSRDTIITKFKKSITHVFIYAYMYSKKVFKMQYAAATLRKIALKTSP